MKILHNNKGIPLMAVGKKAILTTTGSPKKAKPETPNWTFQFKDTEWVCWGSANRYPDDADETIGTVGVLSTGIDYRCRTCAGNGVAPVQITGIDEKGNDIVTPLNDMSVINYLRGYTFRKSMSELLRDIFKYGNGFQLLVFNKGGDRIVGTETLNARHCRLSKDKTKLLFYPDFHRGNPSDPKEVEIYDMLNEQDPFLDLMWRRDTGKLKKPKAIAFPRIKNYFSNNDYYALPQWDAVLQAGWIDVYKSVPEFIKNMYKNAMSIMWHIEIPANYWENEFPEDYYADHPELDRTADMDKRMQDIEENLCSPENANKAFINTYKPDEISGKENRLTITRLDSKLNADEKLAASAAANSEILFSLMINPAVFGAGMPGGSYAGNAGSGSDIREAFMTNIVLNWTERNAVLDPTELMLQFNGYDNIDIKYKDLMLTTLNEGSSTKETIS
ncbi:MAG: hypothetical protein K5882_11115 [Bacteroidales bacterium]|nr:hypothetical protein [Bacteroidales bacterium]